MTTTNSPFTQADLDEITTIAELASSHYRVVASRALCRTGAVLQIGTDPREKALALIQAAGYTARVVANSIVVTGAIDEVALLDAQIAALAARRERLLADRPLDELVEAF